MKFLLKHDIPLKTNNWTNAFFLFSVPDKVNITPKAELNPLFEPHDAETKKQKTGSEVSHKSLVKICKFQLKHDEILVEAQQTYQNYFS